MDNWPALKTKFGHKLIDIDFDVKYPEKSNSVFDKWTEFSKEIVLYYDGNIKDPVQLKCCDNVKWQQTIVSVYLTHYNFVVDFNKYCLQAPRTI